MRISITYCLTMDQFRRNLAAFMRKRELNQVRLSKKTGIAQSVISRYLGGGVDKSLPGLAHLISLAAALGCTLYELTGDERLRDVEADMAKIKEIPPEAEELWEAYKSLDDDNPVKHFIEATLLGKKPDEPKRDDQHDEPEKAG